MDIFKSVPNSKDERIAIAAWSMRSSAFDLDSEVQPFLNASARRKWWLKSVREALQLSIEEVSTRAGICRTTYVRFEERELSGKISLESMRRMAAALDCDLLYALRPKNRKTFAETTWVKIRADVLPRIKGRPHQPQMTGLVMAAIASELIRKAKFRKKYGFTRQPSRSPRSEPEIPEEYFEKF